MALFYVKAREVLFHVYVIEGENEGEAKEIFNEEDESSPIDTECLEYGVESVERIPEKDQEWAKGKKVQAEGSASAHDDLLVALENILADAGRGDMAVIMAAQKAVAKAKGKEG
jgi:hypothetical protein